MHAVLVEEESKNSGIWKFTIIESEHNYELLRSSALPAIRKIYKDENFKKKIALEKAAGIQTKQFYDSRANENVNNPLIIRDYHNERINI
jgi:hypothetical protein